MKIVCKMIMLIAVFLLISRNAYGNTVDYYLEESLEMSGIESVEAQEEISGEKMTFGTAVRKILSGEMDISAKGVFDRISIVFSKEVKSQVGFIKKIVIAALLSAFLKNISDSFKDKSVAELSFFVCYIVLVIFIMSAFREGMDLVKTSSDRRLDTMQAMLPACLSVVFMSGKGGSAAFVYPVISGAAQLLTMFISRIIIPVVSAAITLHMVNFISEKGYLTQFSKLLYSISKWLLRGSAIGFMAVLSLYKLGTPAINQLLGKSAKAAIGAIPVVGDVMGSAAEIVAALSKSIGSSMAAAAIIFLIIMALIPVIKLLVMGFIFKLTAAFAEPICEGRVIKALSGAGDFTFMLMGILFVSEAIFVFSIIILVSFL